MYLNCFLCRGLCTARSALPSVTRINEIIKPSEHPFFFSRYLNKGIYNGHLPLPKFVNIWDIDNPLLSYYDHK